MFDDCLIMAGGSGTRLWPASNSKKPKQFLPAGNDKTFFSLSLERAFKVIRKDTGRVIIITGETHLAHVVEACSALDDAEKKRLVIIPEPLAKNTAPAIACAITYSRITGGLTVGLANGDRSMLVLTSDHIIKPLGAFKKDAAAALQYTKKGALVVFGIAPSRPETGYGYIEAAVRPAENVHEVVKFHEKPNQETAEKYIAAGRYFWNLGMFAFDCGFMEKEFRRLAAPVIRPFDRLRPPGAKSYKKTKGLKVLSNWEGLEGAYRKTKSISFDYAVTTHCARIAMVSCGFEWVDVGSWDEYACIAARNKNVYTAGDCGGNFVDSDVPVALVGVRDLIVVIRTGRDGSPQTALIAKKGETQRVRDIVEQIKKEGKTENL